MSKPKSIPRPLLLTILVDGSLREVDPYKISDRDYKDALSIGIAELIHKGQLRLVDIS